MIHSLLYRNKTIEMHIRTKKLITIIQGQKKKDSIKYIKYLPIVNISIYLLPIFFLQLHYIKLSLGWFVVRSLVNNLNYFDFFQFKSIMI